jgi:hypothetical protein
MIWALAPEVRHEPSAAKAEIILLLSARLEAVSFQI